MALKKRKAKIFFKKYALKCHENAFFVVSIVKESIFIVESETGPLTFFSSQRGSESGSGSEKIVSDPQHCWLLTTWM
jgi:hypothetical protein